MIPPRIFPPHDPDKWVICNISYDNQSSVCGILKIANRVMLVMTETAIDAAIGIALNVVVETLNERCFNIYIEGYIERNIYMDTFA